MRSVLVSMLVNMGDVVMMTSALNLLRKHFPGIKTGVLVRPESVDIVQNNPAVDQVIVYPYKSGSPLRGLGRLIRTIKKGQYDCFFSLDRRPRGAAAALLAGVRSRIGPELLFEGSRPAFWTKLLFTRIVPMNDDDCRGSQVDMFQLPLRRAFNLAGPGHITLPPVKPATAEKVAALFANASGPVIGLGVKTNDPAKTWPADRYPLLIKRLKAELGAVIYIIGSPADRPYTENILRAAGQPDGVLNLAGRTSLEDLMALAPRTDLALMLDNGATHLMANSGLKRLICLLVGTTTEKIEDSMPQARFIQVSASTEPKVVEAEIDLVFRAVSDLLNHPED